MSKNVKETDDRIHRKKEKGSVEIKTKSTPQPPNPDKTQQKSSYHKEVFHNNKSTHHSTPNGHTRNKSYSKSDKFNRSNRHKKNMQEDLTPLSPSLMVPPEKRDSTTHHSHKRMERASSLEENSNPRGTKPMWAKLEEEGIFPLRKSSTKFPNAKYFCRLCSYHCDTLEICKKHSQDSYHRYLKETSLLDRTLVTIPPPTKEQYDAITELLEKIALEHGITDQEIEQRVEIKNELEKKLQEIVPEATLEMSGSTLSGLALKSSDLDLDVVIPESTNRARGLLGIKKILETDNETYTDVLNDLWSSYPCMTFKHAKTGVRVVAGVASLAARNTNILLGHYNSLDPRVKTLVTAFKVWAKMCQIDSRNLGTLSSHCMPIMAVHFFQQTTPPVLPVLHEMITSDDNQEYMDPKDMDTPWESANKTSIGELWVKMFKYYSLDFKTSVHVVNLRHLKPFVRTEARWGKKMAIEDPFQIKRNMTHTVSSGAVYEYISWRFKVTYRYFVLPQLKFGPLFKHLEPEQSEAPSKENGPDKGASELDEDRGARERVSVNGDAPSSEEEELDDEAIDARQEVGDESDVKEEFELSDLMTKASISSPAEEEERSKDLVNGMASISGERDLDEADQSKNFKKINISDLTQSLGTISETQAKHLMLQLTKEMLHYSFDEFNFNEGKKVPLHCTSCQNSGHTRNTCTEDELPPLKPLPPLKQGYVEFLTVMFHSLKQECAPRRDEIMHRDNIVKELEGYIRQFFPSAVLKLFGSSANGFGFGNSDLDICLTFEDSPTAEGIDSIKVIEEISEKLKKSKECRQVLAITTAKVPIVKLTLRRAHLEADLSLYNTLALHNTKLLSTYTAIDYRVQVLGYAMKYFAKLCDIGDASRGSLSSYAYILMVLHFLQRCNPPVIPVLQQLYDPSQPQPELLIDGWNAWFHEDVSTLPQVWKGYGQNKKSVGELWVEMLRYFTETFDWRENVITIRQEETLTKLEKLWTTKCIAIEDPFDLSHNLGGALSRKMNAFILKAFIRGRELFGTCPDPYRLPRGYHNLMAYLFDKQLLTDGAPPNDRCCRYCGHIGHVIKECPRKQHGREEKKREAGAAKATTKDRRPEPVPPPPPSGAEGAAQPPRREKKKDKTPPDEGAEDRPKDVTGHVARSIHPERGMPLQTPSLESDSGEVNTSESSSTTSKVSSPPVESSPCKESNKMSTSPSLSQGQSGHRGGNSEVTEISPNLLFQLARQLDGGAIILPSAAHLPTSVPEKPVALPPPGFAAQPPPQGSSSSSVISNLGVRSGAHSQIHQSPMPPTHDLSAVNKNTLRTDNPPPRESSTQQQLQHHVQQTAQAKQLYFQLQMQQARQQQLLRQLQQQQQQQQQPQQQQPLQRQQLQLQQAQQHLLLQQQLQQSQAQQLKQAQHQQQLQNHLQQALLPHHQQQQPQLSQSQEQQSQQQILSQQQQSSQAQQQVPYQQMPQQGMSFQGRPYVNAPMDGTAFLSHVMTRMASQGSPQQSTPPGLGSNWGPWMTPPPPGMVPNSVSYPGSPHGGSNPSLSALHLQQQHVSNNQQNSRMNPGIGGGPPFPDQAIKDLTPTSESPSFHLPTFGLNNQQQQQQQQQLNESHQRFQNLFGNNLPSSTQVLGGNLGGTAGQLAQALPNSVGSGLSCSPQAN